MTEAEIRAIDAYWEAPGSLNEPCPEDECGCCDLGEFEAGVNPDTEPWCMNCSHSPEEHGL
jgi:hypothetical protein